MRAAQISIVMFGHNAHLLKTRGWVLQSIGYRVHTIRRSAELDTIPLAPPASLLLLCHTLSPKECEDAVTRATARWPKIKKLVLLRDSSKKPSDLLGKVQHSLDIPARLLHTVTELVGHSGSST